MWIQPAAGDAGGSLGAALAIYYEHFKKKRFISSKNDSMKSSYLGPAFSNLFIKKFLDKNNIKYKFNNEKKLVSTIANSLSKGKIIGWFQGGSEYGPRALGNRSILADSRNPKMKDIVNNRVKHRENYRPFAPAVLEEDYKKYDLTIFLYRL